MSEVVLMAHRYRAPTANGAVLAEPGFDAIPALVEANRRLLDGSDVMVGGLPLRELRVLARREVLDLANGRREPAGEINGPLILAGHQPELSHPGVWVKNFALNSLARKLGGIPLHLVVDNDTLKSTSLRFPTFYEGDPASVRMESLAFDTFDGEVPYEYRAVRDEETFRTFANRAEPLFANWGYEPLLMKAWARARRYPLTELVDCGLFDEECPTTTAQRLTHLRRSYERDWGCENLEVPVHKFGRAASFARFVGHILADLPRFHEVYNAAIRRYRSENGIRSANHPAPLLQRNGDWYESPFWRFATARRPFMARTVGNSLELLLEPGNVCTMCHPRDAEEWDREWTVMADMGVYIRPRALTLTLFARVCLGDFFIHGIGGGKYDEVTDAIIRDYFGIEPPAYQVLSATLHLPLPCFQSTADDLTRAERRVRNLHWNPHQHLTAAQLANPDVKALAESHARLAANEPPYAEHAARREWFGALQAIKARLRPLVVGQVPSAEAELARVRSEVEANAILQRRDYSWVLYPEETLRAFLLSV